MTDHPLVVRATEAIRLETKLLAYLQTPVWTAIRAYWGFAFAISGWGKLGNIDGVASWFGDTLHIPFPLANAYAASIVELVGGICLLLGLGGRVATIPLVVTMVVAYATSDKGFIDPMYTDASLYDRLIETGDKFVSATPFTYLMASLLTLLWGAGDWSLDALIAKRLGYEPEQDTK